MAVVSLALPASADAAGGATVAVYSVPGSTPGTIEDLTVGPDGALWFIRDNYPSAAGDYALGRITTAGAVTVYPQPNVLQGLTSGGGFLWGVERTPASDDIAQWRPDGTLVRRVSVPGQLDPGIAWAKSGNVWFTESDSPVPGPGTWSAIGTMSTSAQVTSYPLTGGWPADDIALDGAGTPWFEVPGAQKVGNVSAAGVVTQYDLPANSAHNTLLPHSLTLGSDGAMWLAWWDDVLVRVSAGGAMQQQPDASCPGSASAPGPMTTGAVGSFWYAPWLSNIVCGLSTAGVATSTHTLPAGNVTDNLLNSVTPGPDGRVWVGQQGVVLAISLAQPTSSPSLRTVVPTPGTGAGRDLLPYLLCAAGCGLLAASVVCRRRARGFS